jgi:hypothetical protein
MNGGDVDHFNGAYDLFFYSPVHMEELFQQEAYSWGLDVTLFIYRITSIRA